MGESAVHEIPQGRRRELQQQTHGGEKEWKWRQRGKGNKPGLLLEEMSMSCFSTFC